MLRLTALIVTALFLAGCDAGGSRADGPHRMPLRFHDGAARIEPPLSARRESVIVAAGRYVVVFGGMRSRGETQRWLPDGAVYDVRRETWTRMPRAPFARGLYRPAGVWTGSQVVVLGSPCGTVRVPDVELPECATPDPQVAVFSPLRNSWGPVGSLDVGSADTPFWSGPLTVSSVGVADGRAVFAVEVFAVEGGGSFDVDPVTLEVSPIPSPPVGPAAACALDGTLFAFGVRSGAMHTAVWESGAWDTLASVVLPEDTAWHRLSCGPDAVAYAADERGLRGRAGELWWFDAPRRRWSPLPAPETGALWIGFAPARVGATRLLRIGPLFQLTAGATKWTVHWAPPGRSVGEVGGLLLISVEPADVIELRLVALDRLPAP